MDTNTITETISAVVIEAADAAAAERFYAAFGVGSRVRVRQSDAPSSGFRGFTLSLVAAQPGDVDAVAAAALAAGATTIKAPAKSLWGYGGTLQAPDGTIWKLATSAKKDSRPAAAVFDRMVLLLGVDDVAASKRFYVERGIAVGKSFGSYVEFETPGSPVGLGLYKRRALAKDAGVPERGDGSHRVAIAGVLGAALDPDGFAWEAPAA
ncbi:glyoxalase [Agromyces soli]